MFSGICKNSGFLEVSNSKHSYTVSYGILLGKMWTAKSLEDRHFGVYSAWSSLFLTEKIRRERNDKNEVRITLNNNKV
jgi:hypothetical protein